jgi:serine/threonine protein kinase
VLGDGAYGEVFKAQNKITKQIVALKQMKLLIESEGVPSTVIREISILREFSHPNIVKLIDIIIQDKSIYVILEYLDSDLKNYLENMDRDRYLSQLQVKNIMYQLLLGTTAMHS